MELWQLDVVGGVLLLDGKECKVLTGIDDHSRFVVCARDAPSDQPGRVRALRRGDAPPRGPAGGADRQREGLHRQVRGQGHRGAVYAITALVGPVAQARWISGEYAERIHIGRIVDYGGARDLDIAQAVAEDRDISIYELLGHAIELLHNDRCWLAIQRVADALVDRPVLLSTDVDRSSGSGRKEQEIGSPGHLPGKPAEGGGGGCGASPRSRRNVEVFTTMFLSLRAGCIEIAGSAHDKELAEAKGLAAYRWDQLLAFEAQIPRDEATLAVLELGRGADAGDQWAPEKLIAHKDAAHRERIESERAAIRELKAQTKAERKELESYTRR